MGKVKEEMQRQKEAAYNAAMEVFDSYVSHEQAIYFALDSLGYDRVKEIMNKWLKNQMKKEK